ncbi:tRNA lysidine(34) synthetase TilS [Shewanella colwelliana]|uniref:tRNA lysidine(34) synthetase TilS n=1 Tax=Shewanella colwelliana TaxID=23 RepID=UPI00299CD4A7|nr:tRNA lysidine(34) synthetase TilS [Shewanella colwelliana]MDX1281724.1 tRNA lysidine(34) synthetase TilS [Shewanella colwelliana]
MALPSFSPCKQIEQLIAEHRPVAGTQLVLAYSGGVDSEVLAYGLAEFAQLHPEYRYLLVHVHHGLSDNAAMWQTHCETRAKQYQLPIVVKRVQVDSGPRVSIEAAAREARYSALQSVMEPGDILLTAHHQDDQLETLLLALKRGLGPKGLAAMGTIQGLGKHFWLVRPLLDIQREQIETFANAQALAHIEDESNADSRFDRNFLRLHVIPQLKLRWPAIAATTSRSAQLCADQQALIDEEVGARLPAMLVNLPHRVFPVLDLKLLAAQRPLWRAQLLRGFIESQGHAMPSVVQLQQALSQLLDAKPDAKVEIRFQATLLRRFRHYLYLSEYQPRCNVALSNLMVDITTLPLADVATRVQIDPQRQLQFFIASQGVRVRMPMPGETVSVRFAVPGSLRCHPHMRDKGRELKKLWQEFDVPPWERDSVPLLYFNERIVAAIGYWVERKFVAASDQMGLDIQLK